MFNFQEGDFVLLSMKAGVKPNILTLNGKIDAGRNISGRVSGRAKHGDWSYSKEDSLMTFAGI